MAYRHHLKILLVFVLTVIVSSEVAAQQNNYTFTPAPDLWYNQIDGIRLGVRILGEMEGTFQDGPHRLDAGFWLSTWFPDLPVSYYTSFTEPIPSISDFGSEGSVQAITSIRTGYSQHQLRFNKRWQPGFDEYRYHEISIYFSQEKAFDLEYRPYPQLWQDNWKSVLGFEYRLSANPESGRFFGVVSIKNNVHEASGKFTTGTAEATQRFDLNDHFKLRLRGFAGLASDNTANEYLFMNSMNSAQNWLSRGLSRAKGTIPQPWLDAGLFQIGGGANLRGYLDLDISALENGSLPLYQSIIALNTELEFPNFIGKKLDEITIIGSFIELRTYLFFDVGRPDFLDPDQQSGGLITETSVLADAGAGLQFSFNIPDYLGKDRGLFLRYDIPFWISKGEQNFDFRQLIGIGAIISF